VTIRTGK